MSARAGRERHKEQNRDCGKSARYDIQLFVAGEEPNSALARATVERICTDHLGGDYRVEVIDVLKDPQPARKENIFVTPALVVRQGSRRTVFFGNLTHTERVLAALNVGSVPG